jgi:hypothetical protein
MKIIEVLQKDEKALFEIMDAANDTELLTEDVIKVINSTNGPFSEPVTLEESNARMRAMLEANGIIVE